MNTSKPLLTQVVTALSRRDLNTARSALAQAHNAGLAPMNTANRLASEALIGLSQSAIDEIAPNTASLIALTEACVIARMDGDMGALDQIERLMKAWPRLAAMTHPVVFGEVSNKALSMQEHSVLSSSRSLTLDQEWVRNELRIRNCTAAVLEHLREQRPKAEAEAESNAPRG